MTENHVFHEKSNYIEIRYHYIHDMVLRGAIKLHYVIIDEKVAYVFTKPLCHVKF
jgi:hypothetical protein